MYSLFSVVCLFLGPSLSLVGVCTIIGISGTSWKSRLSYHAQRVFNPDITSPFMTSLPVPVIPATYPHVLYLSPLSSSSSLPGGSDFLLLPPSHSMGHSSNQNTHILQSTPLVNYLIRIPTGPCARIQSTHILYSIVTLIVTPGLKLSPLGTI